MTIEDVDWLLRFPCDELQMNQETLNQMGTAIAKGFRPGVGIVYRTEYDANQRVTKNPESVGGRKITLTRISPGIIAFYVRGEFKAHAAFFESEITDLERAYLTAI